MSRRGAEGFAVLALTALLAGVAVLAWSVTAPTALQLRAAGGLACRSASVQAAERALAEGVEALRSRGPAAGASVAPERFLGEPAEAPACGDGESCYRIERYAEQFRIRALGPACGERRSRVVAGGRIEAQPSGSFAVHIRWHRVHRAGQQR